MSKVDTVSTDVLIIGGGPSGLATAIHLADILKQKGQNRRILLIDKGSSIGAHILSGAVIKPAVFKEFKISTDCFFCRYGTMNCRINSCTVGKLHKITIPA